MVQPDNIVSIKPKDIVYIPFCKIGIKILTEKYDALERNNAMEQRKLFIKAWLSQCYSKTALCEQFGVSRPTANKWIKRHEQVGFTGFK